MKEIPTGLPGVVCLEPKVFSDPRGFFMETFSARRYEPFAIPGHFVQSNHSRSRRGIVRGLHYQRAHPQGKLVWVSRGAVLDVAVDIRVGSPFFGRFHAAVLSDENHHQLYVPPGFAHGFAVLSEEVDFLYCCTDYYDPGDECGILWNDPDIGIPWPEGEPLLSAKDRLHPRLRDADPARLPRFGEEQGLATCQ